MKCDFYTYNPKVNYYKSSPVFTSKPIKVDWQSESGISLLSALDWLAKSTEIILKSAQTANKEDFDLDSRVLIEYGQGVSSEEILKEHVLTLTKYYKKSKDPKIMEKHRELLAHAIANKELLRGSAPELSDRQLYANLLDDSTVNVLGLIGLGNMKAAIALDIDGYNGFVEKVSSFMDTVSSVNLEKLKLKINPENTNEYRDLEESVTGSKKQITKLLGSENLKKRDSLLAEIEILKAEGANDLAIKELKKQIQQLYIGCENSGQIKILMQQINEKQKKMKEILNQKLQLSPQEVVSKVWVLANIANSPVYKSNELEIPPVYLKQFFSVLDNEHVEKNDEGNYVIMPDRLVELFGDNINQFYKKDKKRINKDIKELISLLNISTPENDKKWKDNLNKKIWEYANLPFNKNVSDMINFVDCKYLEDLINSDNNFWCLMTSLLCILDIGVQVPEVTIAEVLDMYEPNLETRIIYDKRGISYEKWTTVDEKSCIEGEVELLVDDVKRKVVQNMREELTSNLLLNSIPAEVSDSLYNKLQSVGVKVSQGEVTINDRNIEFEDLDLIMSVIKNELNDNSFWSRSCDDEKIEKARDTVYYHFMCQRKQEISMAKQLKDNEKIDVKVQKVNMCDIKHSIGLGNDAHCCTGLGSHANEWSAISYILNRCISAIELVANGEAVGNTMIYLADVNDELSLVLDNIELKTKYQNNDKIRDLIFDYAKQVCTDIGKPDIPIYVGSGINKVDMSECEYIKSVKMNIVGPSNKLESYVYLDYDHGDHFIGEEIITDLYRCR